MRIIHINRLSSSRSRLGWFAIDRNLTGKKRTIRRDDYFPAFTRKRSRKNRVQIFSQMRIGNESERYREGFLRFPFAAAPRSF
jgi:hypothetical protein